MISTVSAGAATAVGRRHLSNEDGHLVADAVFAVADGMGGHAAGEVASAMALSRLRSLAAQADLSPDSVLAALTGVSEEIFLAGAGNADQCGMGTTVAGLALVRMAGAPHWLVFNVGDSRGYRFAGGVLTQLTVDHSEVAELVAAGTLTLQDAQRHPRRNVITRALGSRPAPEIDVWMFPPDPAERFLLCTDGLCQVVSDAVLAAALGTHSEPRAAAEELIALAVAAGAEDDVTAVVVDLQADLARADERTVPRASLPKES
ncbi:PP2C family serine/threonine-protein phosphatase [Kutzneria buriramensis]|uniref:Protein phosphatase n=1 Tax=Kutzneria buriramensis TaxID=1045776 RepID=A0A3E0GVI8_9PSEU|nr:protein phosphatase 2C domain-containing protein [Kutzneria buriramensis]REH30670.1 protein phosphatase [Kutzneria buriramensis]